MPSGCACDPWTSRSGLFVVLSTVWPLASLLLREGAVGAEDAAAVLPIVKLSALLLLVRLTVTSESQVLRCIRLVVWPAVALALVAILQTLQFGPVLAMLSAVWASDDGADELIHRGSSTLMSPIATGDYIIISLVLVICCGARGLLGRHERLVLGLVLGTGVLAAGQFSTWISAAVAAVLILWRYPELRRRSVRFAPIGVLALAVGAPALIGRLQGFGDGFAVPTSWLGRWDNVMNIHMPHFDITRVFMGVEPDPVLQAPETWREVVYLEAGYLQFVWIGGLPLLLAFIWLSVAVLRYASALPKPATPTGACVSALMIVWVFLLVLTTIDAHLTMRGAGELIFLLLGLATAKIDERRTDERTDERETVPSQ